MSALILHPITESQMQAFLDQPSHALLLSGPMGVGKMSLARQLAAKVLSLTPEKLASYPHLVVLGPENATTIGIEAVRALEHFMALKVSGKKGITRIAVIENAHTLTDEAQNALLKILEEPPENSLLILTATLPRMLLPTILSRLQTIAVRPPAAATLAEQLQEQGFTGNTLKQALALGGGLPGLVTALLNDTAHPLLEAAQLARKILQGSPYDRLLLADSLSKQRQLCQDILSILPQMASLGMRSASGKNFTRWQTVLKVTHESRQALLSSAQPKLVLTHLMLNL